MQAYFANSGIDWNPKARKILPMRLKELRKKKGLTQEQMADRAGLSTAHYNRLENATRPVNTHWLTIFGGILNVSPAVLLGEPDSEGIGKVQVQSITVRGAVQGGSWVEALEWDLPDRYDVVVPELPREAQNAYGLKVQGPSMNMEYPDGSVVICVPLLDFWRDLKSGDHVIVERRDNGSVEGTVKELQIDTEGHAWLWPRSTDPMHQQPLETGWPPSDSDTDTEVAVTAVVVGSYRQRD